MKTFLIASRIHLAILLENNSLKYSTINDEESVFVFFKILNQFLCRELCLK